MNKISHKFLRKLNATLFDLLSIEEAMSLIKNKEGLIDNNISSEKVHCYYLNDGKVVVIDNYEPAYLLPHKRALKILRDKFGKRIPVYR